MGKSAWWGFFWVSMQCVSASVHAASYSTYNWNAASPSCVSRVSEALNVLHSYWPIPGFSTFERKDKLEPVLLSSTPFQGLSGQQTVKYSVSSSYKSTTDDSSPIGVSPVLGGIRMQIYMLKLSNSLTLTFNMVAPSCAPGTKWRLELFGSTVQPGLSISDNSGHSLFVHDLSTLCQIPSQSFSLAISGAQPSNNVSQFQSGVAALCSSGDVNCSTIRGAISAFATTAGTTSMNLSSFCNLFQNGF